LNQQLNGGLLDQSVIIPGPTNERLCQAARDAGLYIANGVNERNSDTSGCTPINYPVASGGEYNPKGLNLKAAE
jgi:hypothetical protein